MKQIRRHVTYANVMSSLAVFMILGGATAMAAKVGTGQLKAGSVKTGKIAKEAVKSGKIAKNAVTESKIADGAVTSAKIANEAVTTEKIKNEAVTSGKIANGAISPTKLEEAERSQVIASSASSEFDFVDTYNPATWTTVMSLNLPAGNWVVEANIGVAITAAKTHIGCRLIQNGTVLAQSGTEGEVLGIIPSLDGINMGAVAGAGQVTVTCGDNANGAAALQRSLIATRAGSITAG